jgi:hypothetical protein
MRDVDLRKRLKVQQKTKLQLRDVILAMFPDVAEVRLSEVDDTKLVKNRIFKYFNFITHSPQNF